MTDVEHNELLLDVIIAALEGYLEGEQEGNEYNHDPQENELWKDVKSNFSYLLGQAIRQWRIPDENWHTSVAADNVWNALTNEPIDKKGYKESFECQPSAIGKIVPRFSGATRKYGKLSTITINKGTRNGKGTTCVFNDIFIAEHTTTVSDIRDALEGCYLVHRFCRWKRRNEMRNILNKMHITQMLKIEDRRIIENHNRIFSERSYLNPEERKKDIYNYMSITKSIDIYDNIREKCYNNLPKNTNVKTKNYKAAIKAIKQKYLGKIPNDYKAIELRKKYDILIKK